MFRELRIAVIIVLIYVIYGLTSFFSLGDFVTPFFLTKLILVVVSFVFLVLNWRVDGKIYLLLAFLSALSLAAADSFSINLITKSGQREFLYQVLQSRAVLVGSFFVFFGFYYTSLYLFQNQLKKWRITLLLFSLLTTSLIGLLFFNFWIFEIPLALYLLLYFIFVFRQNLPEKSVLSILSALFLLQLLLESFKYLF